MFVPFCFGFIASEGEHCTLHRTLCQFAVKGPDNPDILTENYASFVGKAYSTLHTYCSNFQNMTVIFLCCYCVWVVTASCLFYTVCVCVCVCVYMYICIYMCMQIRKYLWRGREKRMVDGFLSVVPGNPHAFIWQLHVVICSTVWRHVWSRVSLGLLNDYLTECAVLGVRVLEHFCLTHKL